MQYNYELTILTAGEMPESESKKVIDGVKKLLPKEAVIVKEDDWGLKDLAYHISKNAKAKFVQIKFTAESDSLKNLNKALNIEEGVLRYLLLKHGVVKDEKAVQKVTKAAKKSK